MTRWLSAEEQTSWRAYLDATTLLSASLDRTLQQDSQMPLSYYEVLVHLSEARDRTLRMNELADRSLSSRSRLSHAVTRMEERGWIKRRPCDDDRRGQFATLTDIGFAALHAAAPRHVEAVRELIVDRLTAEEFAELGRLSAILRAGLQDGPQED
ncbi:MAG: MarR family transcriptional regulator [Pseudonocardiales bacterium]|nr:MarR family transcriptional regulator [Jatrophihabitantaceae bacterium]MCW2603422.1 MarR family transcriptional regulator [Pseudonocardiales bacterium]